MQTKASMLPKEHEMLPRDKYTTFNASSPGYRKSIHKVGLRHGVSMERWLTDAVFAGPEVYETDTAREPQGLLSTCNERAEVASEVHQQCSVASADQKNCRCTSTAPKD